MTDPTPEPTDHELIDELQRAADGWQRIDRARLRRQVLEDTDSVAAESGGRRSVWMRAAIPVAGAVVLVVAIGLAMSERTHEAPSVSDTPVGTVPADTAGSDDATPTETTRPEATAPAGTAASVGTVRAGTIPAGTVSAGSGPPDGTVRAGTIPAATPPGTGPPNLPPLFEQLAEELEGRFNGLSVEADGIVVELRSGDVELAEELLDRYGDEIRIRVGALPYPLTGNEDGCPTRDFGGRLSVLGPLSDIGIEVESPLPALQPSESDGIQFDATVKNLTDAPVVFGAVEANIVTEDGRILTTATWGVDAMLQYFEVPARGTAPIPATLPVASCDPDLGYRIGRGQHWAVLRLLEQDGAGGPTGWRYSEPVPVTILP